MVLKRASKKAEIPQRCPECISLSKSKKKKQEANSAISDGSNVGENSVRSEISKPRKLPGVSIFPKSKSRTIPESTIPENFVPETKPAIPVERLKQLPPGLQVTKRKAKKTESMENISEWTFDTDTGELDASFPDEGTKLEPNDFEEGNAAQYDQDHSDQVEGMVKLKQFNELFKLRLNQALRSHIND